MKKSLLMLCAGAMLATTNAQARVAGNSFGALELGVGYAGVSAKVKNTALITVKGKPYNATRRALPATMVMGCLRAMIFI